MIDSASISYRIKPGDPAAHILEVFCRIPKPDADGQRVSLPAWVPGSYLVRDYARHLLAVSARSSGRGVRIEKVNKATWQCEPCDDELEIRCEVYAYDLSVRGAYLDTQRCFFNGVCVFLQVEGASSLPCSVEIQPPDAPESAVRNWQVATAMAATQTDERGFGHYRAGDYDELIDHPFEISDFSRAQFVAGGVPHEIVLAGRHRADIDRLCQDLPKICEQHIKLFDDVSPMERYVFLTNVVGDGYGGLEHRASSALITRRSDLPGPQTKGIDKPYRRFLGLVSHEYFHLWNIKRIKPAAFSPFDLSGEAYTRLLWVFEGVTSYYDDLALVRSGLVDRVAYLELLSENVNKVLQTPGRKRQTLEQSSFDAWIKLYKPDENTVNAVISYYSKGALVALALDLTIRIKTNGKRSLDDVMRELWRRNGREATGLEEDGFEKLAAEISGVNLSEFFDQAVRSTEDLPLAELLKEFGVSVELGCQSETINGQPGGDSRANAALGVKIRDDGGKVTITSVLAGAAAQQAGLAGGDELLAIDGYRVTATSYTSLLAQYQPREQVTVSVFRRDELLQFNLQLGSAPKTLCRLTLQENVTAKVEERRSAWFQCKESAI
ncbi:MAG: M61 family metallopeptidase [Gammaproteobacteria bacterium]|nr:M61 family metallopeptidase [Gammaproteobacteria bacterium]